MRPGIDSLQAEIAALQGSFRDRKGASSPSAEFRERLIILYRGWLSSVRPHLEQLGASPRDLRKLEVELEKLSKAASTSSSAEEFARPLKAAPKLLDRLLLGFHSEGGKARALHGDALFLDEIPDLPVWLVPPPLLGYKTSFRKHLKDYPFDTSVFVMIRYRQRTRPIINAIKKELTKQGLNGIVASDLSITNNLFNPVACLLSCARGIAVFDREEAAERYNPNVSYELGMMHLLSRETLLLKHSSLPKLQTDILMMLYEPFTTAKDVRDKVKAWTCVGRV